MQRADLIVSLDRARRLEPSAPINLLADLESAWGWVCATPQDRQNVASLVSWVHHRSDCGQESDKLIETTENVIDWLRESVRENFAVPGGDQVIAWFTNRMKR